jgi:hypothetical protein
MPQEPLHIEDINGMPHDSRVLRLSGPITISNFFQFQSLARIIHESGVTCDFWSERE